MKINKVIFFALSFAFVNYVNAQTEWTGALSRDWNNAGNWTAGIPGSSDAVTIPNVLRNPII